MRIKSSVLLILLTTILLQGCGIGALIKKADKRYEIGEYYAAGNLYKRVYSSLTSKEKSQRAKIAFRQAECYRLTNQGRAEQAYQNAIRYNYSDSIVFLRYAQVLQQNGNYAEAARNYAIYLTKDTSNVVAKNGLISCKFIAEWKNVPSRYVVKRSTELNGRRSSSFSPAFMGSNTDQVVFTSNRSFNKKTIQKSSAITGLPNNDLFMSRKNAAGKWEAPEILEGDINTVNDEGVCSFSADGKIMYYTRSPYVADGIRGTDILLTNRAGGTWSTPQRIKIFKDSTVSVAHPAMSPDGQTLYFVSDSKKGLGGKDIWKATLANGECKFIENLGPDINTPGDEMFPSVRADGTLFFASNGRPGFGGLDIYKATPKKEGGWVVENLGAPINSSGDDFGITFAGNEQKGFFSSNRNEAKGNDAIWSFELPELAYSIEGKVVDEKGNAVPDAVVRMVSNTGVNARVQAKKDGTYRIKLDKNMDCVMLASARGYLNQKNTVSTQGLTDSKTFTVDFKLSAISKPVQLDNIFYEFGKWDLTPASETGLQVLVKLLNDNPNITIEISANTDFVGNNESNKILSEKRAKSVVDYLISKGISKDRLTSVGKGEENPVVVDEYLAKKYKFLQENDVLNENFVTKLMPDQQEIANQINRRTEFRVLKTTYKLY
ncbi:MAG: OmpA family protein [Bacteroidota bacterium]|nr:OmpA family protein [Bacteroidota bacterium]